MCGTSSSLCPRVASEPILNSCPIEFSAREYPPGRIHIVQRFQSNHVVPCSGASEKGFSSFLFLTNQVLGR